MPSLPGLNRAGARWIAVSLLLFGAVLVAYRLYTKNFVSGAERKAAIRAVYGIDSMDVSEISKRDYSRREGQARKLIANAHIAARTKKDKIIAMYLDMYFSSVQLERGGSDLEDSDINVLETIGKTDPARRFWANSFNQEQSNGEHWMKESADDRSRLMEVLQ